MSRSLAVATPTTRKLADASISVNIRRAYRGALTRLDAWRGTAPLTDASLAVYLGTIFEAGRAPATAALAVAAARFRAKLAGQADPAGERTARVLGGYRRTAADRGRGQAAPLRADGLAAILATADRPRTDGRGRRPIYTTTAPYLAGSGSSGESFTQSFQQPFQVRHAFAEFTKLGIQLDSSAAIFPSSRDSSRAMSCRTPRVEARITPASAIPTVTMAMISGVMLPPPAHTYTRIAKQTARGPMSGHPPQREIMRIQHIIVGLALCITAACGDGSSSPTAPTPAPQIVQVAGLWGFTATLTGSTGGGCLSEFFQSQIGIPHTGTMQVTQQAYLTPLIP